MSQQDLDLIPERLAEVRQRIDEAAHRAGRAPSSIQLLAVSKGKPAEAIRVAHAAGQRDFGENYVQELVEKAAALGDLEGIRWHAIGSLQRNKAKQVARVAHAVHAVDRLELIEELSKRASAVGRKLDVLIEVNIGGEASKSGAPPAELEALVHAAQHARALSLVGLMIIPPYDEDPERTRRYFSALRELRDRHGGAAVLPHLSMGMSHDYAVAIEEGATIVRVGTAIFGERLARTATA